MYNGITSGLDNPCDFNSANDQQENTKPAIVSKSSSAATKIAWSAGGHLV
jgi:hypothetical protein